MIDIASNLYETDSKVSSDKGELKMDTIYVSCELISSKWLEVYKLNKTL